MCQQTWLLELSHVLDGKGSVAQCYSTLGLYCRTLIGHIQVDNNFLCFKLISCSEEIFFRRANVA